MAARYFVGSGTNWSSTASWAATTGGASGATVPTATDDVFLDANSPGNLTIDAAASCRSIDCTGFTHVLTHAASVTLTVGTTTAPPGNVSVKFVAGMTYTLGSASSSALTFNDSSGVTNTFDSGGKTFGAVAINNGTTTTTRLITNGLTTSPGNTGGPVTVTQGGFDTNSLACSWPSIVFSNSNVRSIKLGASAITLNGSGITVVSGTTTTNLTWDAGTSTITVSGGGNSIQGGPATPFYNVVFTGGGVPTLVNASTFVNLTVTGTAGKTDGLNLQSNQTVTGTLTLGGNSTRGVNRLLVQSNVVGTQRTITAAAVVINGDVDFMDMALAGSPSWTNTGNAWVGNAGGNGPLITSQATAAATQNWPANTTGSWSTVAWTSTGTARVPLPQDNVTISGLTSGTITLDMPRWGATVDFTGSTGGSLNTTAASPTLYGSLTLAAGMSFITSLGTITFGGRGSYTFTTSGVSLRHAITVAVGTTLALIGNLTVVASSGTVTVNGTFSDGGYTYTNPQSINANALVAGSTATVNLTGTWNIGQFGNVVIVFAGATVNASTATFNLTDTSANLKTFVGSGKTYGTLNITGGGTGGVTITGANTFATLTVGAPKTVTFTSATTTTCSRFIATGSAGNVITLNASATTATLSCSSLVSCDWLAVTNVVAAGNTPFYAGANSTLTGTTTGWVLAAAPAGFLTFF